MASLGLWSCGSTDGEGLASDPAEFATARAPVTTCPWDPVFGTRYCSQSDWWIEFSVKDSTVATLSVEVAGNPVRVVSLPTRFKLSGGYYKFTGGTDFPVTAGTSIRLRATQAAGSGGRTAVSGWFGYRTGTPAVECAPCAPVCAPGTCGGDGCGGTCSCPTGSVCLSNQTCCAPSCAPGTCGSNGCGGTCTCPTGTACDNGQCVAACIPSCAPGTCGGDGCGGTCTCPTGTACNGGQCVASGCVAPWNPSWQQTTYAGPWWAEYQVVGGSLARSVSLEISGGGSIPLSYAYGKWSGGVGGVASGTTVALHAMDATGATAQTVPFRYLVDTAPLTDPCLGTPSTSPTCTPLARGMVTFTMDDSYPSQDTLARPRLAQYGMRATIYHITNQLSSYGLLPNAQSLAAAGHEVGSHTRTHPDLTSLSAAALNDELGSSKQYLLANVGSPVESIASPMGLYDASVVTAIRGYYSSHRTVNPGLNYMGSDVYELNADGVYNDSTVAAVCAQLAEAAANRGWRILVFHDFTTAATAGSSLLYPIANFEGILRCAQSTPGLDVVTTKEGADKIRCASP